MASLKENALTRIATMNLVDMKTTGSVALFTTPVGKTFYVDTIVIRNNTASLAGGGNYAFTNWRSAIDLSGMSTTNGYRKLFTADNTTYTGIAAGSVFYINVVSGSTLPCTASLDVFGHLV